MCPKFICVLKYLLASVYCYMPDPKREAVRDMFQLKGSC